MTDDTRPEGFDLEALWPLTCGYRLLKEADEPEQTCGGFGPAPTDFDMAVEAGLVGPENVWQDREAFEIWRAQADARIAEAEAEADDE